MRAHESTGASDSGTEEYLKVLELGYANNPAAIEPLVCLTAREGALMRAAAVSFLGTLRATEQFPLLRSIYAGNTHVVKAMALKSIGDLDTNESRAFLVEVRQSKVAKEPTLREVLALYDGPKLGRGDASAADARALAMTFAAQGGGQSQRSRGRRA